MVLPTCLTHIASRAPSGPGLTLSPQAWFSLLCDPTPAMGIFDDALQEVDQTDFVPLFVPGRICLIGEHRSRPTLNARIYPQVHFAFCSHTPIPLFLHAHPHTST